jgi:hypothetical protein
VLPAFGAAGIGAIVGFLAGSFLGIALSATVCSVLSMNDGEHRFDDLDGTAVK